jgi:Zn-dependent membrane protease YugP
LLALFVHLSEKTWSFSLSSPTLLFPPTRSRVAGGLMLLAALDTLAVPALVHLLTLPVEMNASFNRALPVLERGGYLHARQLPGARRILRAAALTYVAQSLVSLLNPWRWLRVLRR